MQTVAVKKKIQRLLELGCLLGLDYTAPFGATIYDHAERELGLATGPKGLVRVPKNARRLFVHTGDWLPELAEQFLMRAWLSCPVFKSEAAAVKHMKKTGNKWAALPDQLLHTAPDRCRILVPEPDSLGIMAITYDGLWGLYVLPERCAVYREKR